MKVKWALYNALHVLHRENIFWKCYALFPRHLAPFVFHVVEAPETSQRDRGNLVSKERILGTWLDWSEFQQWTPNTFIYQIGALNSHSQKCFQLSRLNFLNWIISLDIDYC